MGNIIEWWSPTHFGQSRRNIGCRAKCPSLSSPRFVRQRIYQGPKRSPVPTSNPMKYTYVHNPFDTCPSIEWAPHSLTPCFSRLLLLILLASVFPSLCSRSLASRRGIGGGGGGQRKRRWGERGATRRCRQTIDCSRRSVMAQALLSFARSTCLRTRSSLSSAWISIDATVIWSLSFSFCVFWSWFFFAFYGSISHLLRGNFVFFSPFLGMSFPCFMVNLDFFSWKLVFMFRWFQFGRELHVICFVIVSQVGRILHVRMEEKVAKIIACWN